MLNRSSLEALEVVEDMEVVMEDVVAMAMEDMAKEVLSLKSPLKKSILKILKW